MGEDKVVIELPAAPPAQLAAAVRAILSQGTREVPLPSAERLEADASAAVADRPVDPDGVRRFHALVELGYLAASADGLDPAEREALATILERLTGAVVDHATIDRHLRDLDAAAAMLGRHERLARVAADLGAGDQRDEALGFAALIAMADGRLHEGEMEVLLELGACFALPQKEVRNIVDRVAAAVGSALR
jgi:tellurite resistance protein